MNGIGEFERMIEAQGEALRQLGEMVQDLADAMSRVRLVVPMPWCLREPDPDGLLAIPTYERS